MDITKFLVSLGAGIVGAANLGSGVYRVDFEDGASRAATDAEILNAYKAAKIDEINDECRDRLFARFGQAHDQVSRGLGVYGAAEQQATQEGIADTIDASNAASDAVLAATTIAAVEAVTVTWPVI